VCAVVEYLSDEWMQRAGEALASDERLRESSASVDLSIQYEVVGVAGSKLAYALRFDHGSVGIEPGKHPEARVSFSLGYDTAVAVARGELSAQAAFMRGDLKLGGDVTVLIRQHELLGAMDDALAELRDQTEF
jgi:putative sterol carrier protein